MMTNRKMREFWIRALREQEHWLASHGDNQAGYRAFYSAHHRTEDEADLIYFADMAELRRLEGLVNG